MKQRVATRYSTTCLHVKITSAKSCDFAIKVYDAANPRRVFINRMAHVDGSGTYWVRMPYSPDIVVVEVNVLHPTGKLVNVEDSSFQVSVTKAPLQRRLDMASIGDPAVRSMIDFFTRIAYNFQDLTPGVMYQSDDKKYLIDVKPYIMDAKGNRLTTPASTNGQTGIITASYSDMVNYSFPGRFLTLMHEGSHFYLNVDIANEVEADLNSLLFYLGLGYPRIEAEETFYKIFKASPTIENKIRFDQIKQYIDQFEQVDMKIGA
jgi:hypothetical protein